MITKYGKVKEWRKKWRNEGRSEGRKDGKEGRKKGRKGGSKEGKEEGESKQADLSSILFYFTPTQDLSIEGLALVLSPPFF